MAIVANQTTITIDGITVGCIRSFSVPAGTVKEVDVTCISSSIETFQPSTLQEAQELTFTVIFDTTADLLEPGTAGSFVITFPLNDPNSGTPASWSFDGFVRDAGTIDGEYTSDAPLEQTFTVRLTTPITKTLEA